MTGKLFIISAPSGAGKTTLVERIIDSLQWHYPIARVITYTSKSARQGEKEGRDYFFLSERDFRKKIESGFFMEWSDAYGCYYGSPSSILKEIEQGKSYILILDRAGAQRMVKQCQYAVLIWLYTKEFEVLKQRLGARNTERPEQIEYRLNCARREIRQEINCPICRYHVLNDDFERARRKLEKIIKRELELAGFF